MAGLATTMPVWIRIGLLSFGGPAGQIALMQDEIVARRGWVPAESFDRGLAFSMMLPGPEAQQLATWLGWRIGGLAGGLAAGLAFILPGAALMIALAWVAATQGEVGWVRAIFAGVQPVVIALVLAAMSRIAGRALWHPAHWAIALAAFVSIWWIGLPFPVVIAAAALSGLFLPDRPGASAGGAAPGGWGRVVAVVASAAVLIGSVYLATRTALGPGIADEVADLFTTAALVTFGGAYAVLPFVAERAVESYGWLTPEEMLNGLAIAEATPGPLILVNTYAGFFAGHGPGDAADGATTAVLSTFYTFAPSFALILAFAPMVERVGDIPWARRALAGVSAAVVGVILNLALYLADAAFLPTGGGVETAKLVLFSLALAAIFLLRTGMLALIASGIVAGIVLWSAGLM